MVARFVGLASFGVLGDITGETVNQQASVN
jgi:hypothetical protein